MTFIPWDAKFEDVLRASLTALEPVSPLEPEVELAEYGLDRAGAAAIARRLEETYCVALPDGVVTVRTTPGVLWSAVQDAVEAVWRLDPLPLAFGNPTTGVRELTPVVPGL
ncbi:hypothetical protein AQ490_27280 [Wenjunlia vitaminophila]|uniref:Uncharacterized protein n=1 Tax=Wenjunlia vitaminophila TaxID=76728 RepID=A0A0T6LPQ9_WENVI|nr:hypothetical protein [Wenjunlia vitaminophila]KRV48032.1 hypothetical protein AQ490_27280 [Wenjunlia vitaminophila]